MVYGLGFTCEIGDESYGECKASEFRVKDSEVIEQGWDDSEGTTALRDDDHG